MQLLLIMASLALFAIRILTIFILPPGDDEISHLYIAQDIAHFFRLPIYFYKQQVMGTLESYFIAPFFRLFGFSFWAGRFYYSLLYFAFVVLYLRVVARLFKDRGLTAYLLIFLGLLPFPALFFTTVVGWLDVVILTILSLVLLLKIAEERERVFWPCLLLGFVCGLGIWSNPLFVIWMVPIGISLTWLIPMSWQRRLPFWTFIGFLIGLTPVWIHGLKSGVFMSLEDHAGAQITSVGDVPQMVFLFFARMKYFLSTFSYGPVSPLVDNLVRYLSFVPFVIFAVSFSSLIFFFIRSRSERTLQEKIFYLFITVPPFVFAALYISRNLLRDEGMRFFVQLLIPYSFAVSWWIRRFRSSFWKKTVLGLLIGILSLGYVLPARQNLRRTAELREVIRELETRDLRFGIGQFGISFALGVLSHNRITVTPLLYQTTYEPIRLKVKQEGVQFLVWSRKDSELLRRAAADPNLKKFSVGPYDIYYGDSDFLKGLVDTTDLALYQ